MTGTNKPDLKVVDDDFEVPENVPDDGPEVLEKPKQFWYGAEEFAARDKVREYIIKGWLLAHGITALLAVRGTGKSTIALDLACHLAKDMDWLDLPTMKKWKVIYICGEDEEGLILNLRAWGQHKERGVPPNDRIMFSSGIVKMTDKTLLKARLKEMVAWAGDARCLVILDTWARATTGLVNNAQEDMDLAHENAEMVASVLKGPMLACYHPPKKGKTLTIRGSAVQEDASSGIWHLKKDRPNITLTVDRIKGPGEDNEAVFSMESIKLTGKNEHGDVPMDEHGDNHSGLALNLVSVEEAGVVGSMGKKKLEESRANNRRDIYAKLLVAVYLKDRDRDTSIAALGEEISGLSVGDDNGMVGIPKGQQTRRNIAKYFAEPVQVKAINGETYMVSIVEPPKKKEGEKGPNKSPLLSFTRLMEVEETE